jgi:hypothetical protein
MTMSATRWSSVRIKLRNLFRHGHCRLPTRCTRSLTPWYAEASSPSRIRPRPRPIREPAPARQTRLLSRGAASGCCGAGAQSVRGASGQRLGNLVTLRECAVCSGRVSLAPICGCLESEDGSVDAVRCGNARTWAHRGRTNCISHSRRHHVFRASSSRGLRWCSCTATAPSCAPALLSLVNAVARATSYGKGRG